MENRRKSLDCKGLRREVVNNSSGGRGANYTVGGSSAHLLHLLLHKYSLLLMRAI
jgi:hypothetical protein